MQRPPIFGTISGRSKPEQKTPLSQISLEKHSIITIVTRRKNWSSSCATINQLLSRTIRLISSAHPGLFDYRIISNNLHRDKRFSSIVGWRYSPQAREQSTIRLRHCSTTRSEWCYPMNTWCKTNVEGSRAWNWFLNTSEERKRTFDGRRTKIRRTSIPHPQSEWNMCESRFLIARSFLISQI